MAALLRVVRPAALHGRVRRPRRVRHGQGSGAAMSDLEELMRLARVARMGRHELEGELDRIDAADPYGAAARQSKEELVAEARAVSNVFDIERAIRAVWEADARDAQAEREGRARARRKRSVSMDMDACERDKSLLKDRSDKHKECERMREAVMRRLRHFDRMDGLVYRPTGKMPLERYLESLTRK